MSFKSKLKSMRKPYGNRQTGTYQTRDTSCNQHVSSPKVVHEEAMPPAAPPQFEPLQNHQGAPVQNPVTTVPSTSAGGNTDPDSDNEYDLSVKLSLTEKEENALRGCLFVCVDVILLTAFVSLFMWIVSML